MQPRVVLIGMPASGKSRVGKTCAQNFPDEFPAGFRDLDQVIEAQTGQSIAAIFETQGEAAFRALEITTLRAELQGFDGVLALGGGTLTQPDAQAAVEEYRLAGGLVVYLDVEKDLALERIAHKDKRPLLRDNASEKWESLRMDRYKAFEQAADVRLTVARASSLGSEQSTNALSDEVSEQQYSQAGVLAQCIVQALSVRRVRVAREGKVKYSVNIGSDLVEEIPGAFSQDTRKVFLVHTDSVLEHAQKVYQQMLRAGFDCVLHSVPDAEDAKTIAVYAACLERMAELKMTRQDAVLGVGGGAVTDLAGFLAATYLRGVKCVNVPTSLLAQVDASTGGKTGVNLNAGKNLCGAFYEPSAVFADLDMLKTLPRRESIEGLAEAVKIGLTFDGEVLDGVLVETGPTTDPNTHPTATTGAAVTINDADARLRKNAYSNMPSHSTPLSAGAQGDYMQNVNISQCEEFIYRCVKVKAEVVSQDLFDAGLREFLNYGHTFGHVIEKLEDYHWRHGEAVAVGMVFAADLAHRLGMIPQSLLQKHIDILQAVGLPTVWETGYTFEEVLQTMRVDKKAQGATLRFVLLEGERRPKIVGNPPLDALRASFEAVTSGKKPKI